jgi:CSLREA domain-containing protein
MLRLSRSVLLIPALAAVLSMTPSQPVAAAPLTFVVNSTAYERDANPGDGACSSTPSGACTLRAAIEEANAHPGADTIALPAGQYDVGLWQSFGPHATFTIVEEIKVAGAGEPPRVS